MSDQHDLFPAGLSRPQFHRLVDCADRASRLAIADLLNAAMAHLRGAQAAYEHNRMINVRLAETIVAQFKTVLDQWTQLPTNQQHWLAGAMLYFSTLDDTEPD